MSTIPKCTTPSRRHVWQHVKNLTRTSTTPSTAHIRLVGRYRCSICALRKDGPPALDGPAVPPLDAGQAAPAVDTNQLQLAAELSEGGAA